MSCYFVYSPDQISNYGADLVPLIKSEPHNEPIDSGEETDEDVNPNVCELQRKLEENTAGASTSQKNMNESYDIAHSSRTEVSAPTIVKPVNQQSHQSDPETTHNDDDDDDDDHVLDL